MTNPEKVVMELYENSANKISSKQLTIVLKLQLRVTKFMLIVNNVQFKKWLSSSPLHLIPTFMWGRCTMTYASM